MFDAEAFGKAMGDAISAAVGPLKKEIEELKLKLAEKPDFSKVIAEEVKAEVAAAMFSLPVPKDGKDADMAVVQKMVVDAVAAIPKAKDGESVTIDDVRPMIGEAVKDAVSALPVPKDGKDASVDVEALVAEVVKRVPKAKDGLDGRDALEIDILPEVMPGKSYRHKTFARWRGGLIRSVRNTDPLMPGDDDVLEHGWSVVVNGVDGPIDKGLFDANFVKTFEAALND